jgi:hypothetical protein
MGLLKFLNDLVRNNTLSPARVANALDASRVFTATGTDTYAVSIVSTVTALNSGDEIKVVIPNANTVTTPTLAVTGSGLIGTYTIKANDGTAVAAGDLKAGGTYYFRFDGTDLRVTNLGGGGGSGVDDAIVDGETARAPSQNVVYDALAGKQELLDATILGDFIISLTGKTTPVNADSMVISDSEASGDAKELTLTDLKAFLKTYNDTLYAGVATDVIGVQDLYIPASAMWPKTTAGCADLTKSEIATSLLNIQTLDFDQTTQEHAQFTMVMPRKWNNETVTVVFYWTASAGSGDVIWGIQGVANSNDDPLTTAFGTAQEVTDTLTATNDVCVTSATSAMTLAGTPADADFLGFQIYRKAADGSDTLSGDAKLLGISIRATTDAGKDA